MSTIGTFTKNGDRFDGNIRTLNLNLPSVSFVPVDHRDNDNAPNYRAFSGQAEFGAAWTKESKNQDKYLSVLPTIPACPLRFPAHWCRRRATRGIWSGPGRIDNPLKERAFAPSPLFFQTFDLQRLKWKTIFAF